VGLLEESERRGYVDLHGHAAAEARAALGALLDVLERAEAGPPSDPEADANSDPEADPSCGPEAGWTVDAEADDALAARAGELWEGVRAGGARAPGGALGGALGAGGVLFVVTGKASPEAGPCSQVPKRARAVAAAPAAHPSRARRAAPRRAAWRGT